MEVFTTYRKRLDFPDTIDGSPEDIDVSNFGKYIDILAASRVSSCFLHGNEATLHPQFEKLVSLCQKKKVTPVISTCGLMPEECRTLIAEHQLPLRWRVYHPDFYPEAEREEMTSALDRFLAEHRGDIHLAFTIHRLDEEPAWIIQFMEKHPAQAFTVRVLYSDDMEALRRLTKWLSARIVDFAEHGGQAVLDCGVPLCAFTDDDYGRLAKLGVPVGSCQPRPGILPNMRLYHCDRMAAFPAANASMFKRFQSIQEYFYKRHNGLQWDFRFFKECPECPALRLNTCQGHCLAEKGRRLLKEAERLRDIVAEEANQEALVNLGTLLYELSQFAQAVECMTEARRVDPADVHVHMILARCLWELGKLADAEEEFRKAARLLPDGREVLVELSGRFEEIGKLFKARRLVEEIKRMPPPEASETGETLQ